MPDYVNYNQLLTVGLRRRGGAVLSLLFAVVMITTLVVSNVHGDINLETKKHWGYVIACDHILYIHGVTVTECAEECLYRMNCKSVNYIVHHKYCELCANEDNNKNDIRRGGLYMTRREMKRETVTHACTCPVMETCPEHGASSQCKKKECGTPQMMSPRNKLLGNRRNKGSKIQYFCVVLGHRYAYTQSKCLENGTWTVPPITCREPVYMYEGCYVDKGVRVLDEATILWNIQMTIEMCEAHCIPHSYQYMGVEHLNHCFCGNELLSSKKVDTSQCNTPCAGNPDQICGGAWMISIYEYTIQI